MGGRRLILLPVTPKLLILAQHALEIVDSTLRARADSAKQAVQQWPENGIPEYLLCNSAMKQ